MTEIVIVSTEPETEAARYASLVESPEPEGDNGAYRIAIADAALSVLSQAQYAARYGELASPMNGRESIFGAVVMASPDLAAVTDGLRAMPEPLPMVISGDRVRVRVAEFDSVLEFVG